MTVDSLEFGIWNLELIKQHFKVRHKQFKCIHFLLIELGIVTYQLFEMYQVGQGLEIADPGIVAFKLF